MRKIDKKKYEEMIKTLTRVDYLIGQLSNSLTTKSYNKHIRKLYNDLWTVKFELINSCYEEHNYEPIFNYKNMSLNKISLEHRKGHYCSKCNRFSIIRKEMLCKYCKAM